MFIRRAKYDALVAQLEAAHKALEQADQRAYLISIEREGRMNRFRFARARFGIFVIETMGLLSDDINDWKRNLLG